MIGNGVQASGCIPSTAGCACAKCGTWITGFETAAHWCPSPYGVQQPATNVQIQPWTGAFTDPRIAPALERIAKALEALAAK